MYIKYDSLIIFSRGWSESNGRVRTEKYKIVFLQNERITMIHSALQKGCWTFPFSPPEFFVAQTSLPHSHHLCESFLGPGVQLRFFIPAGTKHFILTTAWRWCALTIKSYISQHLLHLPHPILSLHVPAGFHLYLYLCLHSECEKGKKRLITGRKASIIQAKNQRHFVLKSSEMPREGAF